MKQRMKAKARKIVASILVAAMSVAIIPKITGTGTVFAAGSKNTDDTCLGTSGIAAPSAPGSGWNGSYVYYGTYDNTPIKFRVLAPSTTAYGGSTLFLDSDATLFDRRFDDDSNVWANSELRTYLNGTFLTGGSFTELEQGAIASSTVPAHDLVVGTGAGQVTWWTQGEFGQYVALNDDKIFVLDAEEAENIAYGYRSTDEWCSDREKRGSFSFWWLRSADTYLSADAGGVSNGGNPIHNNVSLDNGVKGKILVEWLREQMELEDTPPLGAVIKQLKYHGLIRIVGGENTSTLYVDARPKKRHYFINADRLVEIDRGDNNITDRNVRYYSLTWTNKYSNPESKNYHPHFGS